MAADLLFHAVPPTAGPPPAAIYARLSRKPTGRRKRRRNDADTVERQVMLCRRYAAEQGLRVRDDHVYVDNHRSAWRADGARPDWDRMMLAGKRGEFAVIIGYKLDRLSRNMIDAEALITLAEVHPIVLDGPNSGRIDLTTAHGRRTFREAAVQAAAESDNTSERARDALAERAANGLQVGGGRLFGFEVLSEVREYDDDVEPVQRPAEADLIRDAARRMIGGETLVSIAADWNERGITTVRGGRWTGGNLGRMLGAPRNGGHVVLHGRIVGRNAGEPILDPDTYGQVQALLAGRKRGRRPTGLWKLTGALICGNPACSDPGHTMAGTRSANGARARKYVCSIANGGCGMSILAEPTEALVKKRVLELANDPDEQAALSEQTRALGDARNAAAAEVLRLDGMLADLEAKLYAEQIRPSAYESAKAVLDKRIAAAEAELERLGGEAGSGGEVDPLTAREYDNLTAAETRDLIRRLKLRVVISPQRPGAPRNRFDPARVVIEP